MLFVRLRESLCNFPPNLSRLVRELGPDLDAHENRVEQQVCADAAECAPYRPNRKLQPNQIAELVDAYRHGTSRVKLAKQHGLHRNTVEAHLRRSGVAIRPIVKMTPRLVERATKFYVEELWTTARIGKELGVDASTVAKALKRAGVRMRPPVAGRG
ncbi:hypothetical protein [Nocardia sp. NPDC004750]